ncbi:MAG TPA: RtcB family protein [Polyangiaceae bacterium]|nr:RtcB family protein [Polyangiaceae bacterium]
MMPIVYPPEGGGQRVPVVAWSRVLSAATLRQLRRLASEPYVVDRVAAMPDAHVAEGVAVGTVFATEDAIVPAALGGDLGCGVAALRFGPGAPPKPGRRELERLLGGLAAAVPVGDACQPGRGVPLPEALASAPLSTRALERQRDALGPRHAGTLGGGNHFLELDRDAGGSLWLLVHTGSRGMGAAVRAHHGRAAEAAGGGSDLAPLSVREGPGAAYLADLGWALAFARENRRLLLARASEVMADVFGLEPGPEGPIDVHHNYVEAEEQGGRPLLVHRKGAVRAREGERVIVPGSMGTATYLARGLGHELAFASCPHGAGRVLSRAEARRRIRPPDLRRAMGRVVFDEGRARALVEEAPQAYRPIGEVFEDGAGLARPVLRLEPLAVLKG